MLRVYLTLWMMVGAQVVAGFFTWEQFKNHQKINNFLIIHTETDKIEANLEVANKWLQEELKKSFNANRGLIEDLRILVSLKDLINDKKCDRDTHAIMLANHAGTKGAAHSDEAPLRRIDKVVYKCFMRHAENCREIYPIKYKNKFHKLDKLQVERVRAFMDKIFKLATITEKQVRLNLSERLWEIFIASVPTIKGRRQAVVARNTISDFAKNDLDKKYLSYVVNEFRGKRVIDKEKIKSLFGKYLLAPCRYYIAELGPDIFIPAKFDDMVDHYVDDRDRFYYLGWARFRLCEALIRDQNALLQDIIKVIMKEELVYDLDDDDDDF